MLLQSFETFVVDELLKQASWTDDVTAVGHWRTHDGHEVDLVVERDDGAITGFEVKAGRDTTPRRTRPARPIDEAAMVGTRALSRLFDAADAGGVPRGLEKRMPTIGLTENRRQRYAWERVALADLRAGEMGRFLTAYQAHGRTHIGGTADSAKQQLIPHWSTLLRFQRDVVILALGRNDVADLNCLARREMLNGRRLGPEALIAGDREFRTRDRAMRRSARVDYARMFDWFQVLRLRSGGPVRRGR